MDQGHAATITRSVRTIAVPPGEAPLWVREKWVGLMLPVMGPAETHVCFGVLSGPRTFLTLLWAFVRGGSERIYGFPVNAARAVEILGYASPEAAAWWRENAAASIQPSRSFLFHAEVCEALIE